MVLEGGADGGDAIEEEEFILNSAQFCSVDLWGSPHAPSASDGTRFRSGDVGRIIKFCASRSKMGKIKSEIVCFVNYYH